MASPGQLILALIIRMALACITAPCIRTQDCHHYPEECDAKKILSDFTFLNDLVTSGSAVNVYCDSHERTSLSEDGTKAEYYLVYKMPGNTTRMTDTCTYEAMNNTLIAMNCRNYSSYVYLFTLDYIDQDHCFVGHYTFTPTSDAKIYIMLGNPDYDTSEYDACFKKIYAYTGGKIIFLRDPEMCKNFPLKPQ